jgi:nicotinamidase-related amidase
MSELLELPAKPFPFQCDKRTTALVVIDMQNDFCSPGGFGELLGNHISQTRAIIPKLQQVLAACREHGVLIIHTREGHLPDLSDCPPTKQRRSQLQGAGIGDMGPMGRILVRGERGHEIVAELAPAEGELIIDKSGKGAFYRTPLEAMLQARGIASLVLTGVTTHVCVHTTLREANDRGYECLVLEDGTAAFDPADQEAAIRMVHQQGGIFGWVGWADDWMAALRNANDM